MLFYHEYLRKTPTYSVRETMAGYNPYSGVLNLYSALLVSLELDFHFIIGLLIFWGPEHSLVPRNISHLLHS